MPVIVKQLLTEDRERWDAFVQRLPEATFFHQTGWKDVIERGLGHSTYYFFAEREGQISAVLPLAHIRSWLFGRSLISLPFCAYGGIAGNDAEAVAALEETAVQLAEKLHVDYLETRNLAPRHKNWPTKELYVTFRSELEQDPEKAYLAIPRKQRAMVRKGVDAGLKVGVDHDVDRFFDVYSESVRNLGTPVFPVKYFRSILDTFGKQCEILTVWSGRYPVSAVMSFYFRDEVLPYYGGGKAMARALKANDYMYWELMRRSVERGVRLFDYGRSKMDSGSYRFKKHWGFKPAPLSREEKDSAGYKSRKHEVPRAHSDLATVAFTAE